MRKQYGSEITREQLTKIEPILEPVQHLYYGISLVN